MRYLLAAINAKYIHSNLGIYSLRRYAMERLGLGQKDEQGAAVGMEMVSEAAEGANRTKTVSEIQIDLGEYTINHQMDQILQDIYRRKPDVVGFSCYIWNIVYVKELIHDLKKVLPQVRIWMGGPEASYDAVHLMDELPEVELIMQGEGEETFTRLVEACECRTEVCFSELPGIVLRRFDGTIEVHRPAPLMNLDDIPFSYGDLSGLEHRIIYYESSRGCPFSCSYCLSSVDKRLRFRDIELVKKELQFFLDHNVPQVKFVDRTFNCKHDHSIAIWKYIMEHDNGITNFHFEIAADILNEEELELLEQMRPGLVQLEIGVQSTNPKTIKEIHRVMDFEKVSRIVRRIQERGNVHEHLDLIAGLPYEDVESFAHSFDDVYALKPEQLQLGFLKVLKGSFMQEHQKEYGIVHKAHPPYEVLYTKWISYEDVLRLKGVEEMVEVYYNSRQFTNTMEELEKEYDSAFDMYDRLAAYYEENDYNSVQHKRSARYEILLNYVRKYHKEKEDLFREVLTYDYYLRENAKSRPGFAGEYPVTKDVARAFYETEEETHEYLPDYGKYDRNQMRKMTHLEYFKLTDTYILFDYQNRNPLNQEARVCKIEKIKL